MMRTILMWLDKNREIEIDKDNSDRSNTVDRQEFKLKNQKKKKLINMYLCSQTHRRTTYVCISADVWKIHNKIRKLTNKTCEGFNSNGV